MAASSTSRTSSSAGGGGGGGEPEMDRRLLEAASCGHSRSMQAMASQDPSILLGRTPRGSSCLHISCIHGHAVFCTDVVALEESLLTTVNLDGETPLITAVTCGRVSLASLLLGCYRERRLSEAILQQDMDGSNALHHAIRSGHKDLALELIAAEPALSRGVNKYNESPMFLAVLRDFTHVFEKLLEIPDSAHGGHGGFNALHVAIENGNADIARKVMEKHPWLARESGWVARDGITITPTRLAVHYKKIEMLRVLLEHDTSLGYEGGNEGVPLLNTAAFAGHVDVAEELLKHCPDAPNRQVDDPGWTCLHSAVQSGQTEFVEFILKTPQLEKLVNMRDSRGKTALHWAVHMCNPKIVAALLSHKDIDTAVRADDGMTAVWELPSNASLAKSLNWNQVCMLMAKADPREANILYYLRRGASQQATNESRKEARSLTQTYTSNTSLVAILIATITFAAAFTMPGGYSTDAGTEGLPIMSRKFAFQAFLISDTLAMCSSFAVAFICIIARWEDYEFLIYYRTFTKKLMWFAYVATTTAFATGLYTVLAPRLHWLAIGICFLVPLLPILTKLLGEWPVLKLKIRLGQAYNSDLLDMV